MTDDPSFDLPARPERRYPASGGVEYEGEVVFSLHPADGDLPDLEALVADVLAGDRYVRGDFFDLPAPAYLVRDLAVGSSLRVVVRPDRIQLHVLPHTDQSVLEDLYAAIDAASDVDWTVESRTQVDDGGEDAG